MTPADLKDWKVIVAGALLLATGGGGGAVFANGKATREEVKVMIAEAPAIIVLQQDVKHIVKAQEQAAIDNKAAHEAILNAIRANGK